jgi:hypothetical protein
MLVCGAIDFGQAVQTIQQGKSRSICSNKTHKSRALMPPIIRPLYDEFPSILSASPNRPTPSK